MTQVNLTGKGNITIKADKDETITISLDYLVTTALPLMNADDKREWAKTLKNIAADIEGTINA